MTKMYVLTSGYYSDHRAYGVFSTRELADDYVSQWHTEAEHCWINEFDIDPNIYPLPEGYAVYSISIRKNGQVICKSKEIESSWPFYSACVEAAENEVLKYAFYHYCEVSTLYIRLLAKSQEQAEKNAIKLKNKLIETGEWDLAVDGLRRECENDKS